MPERILVITAAHNEADYIEQTLRSVSAQTRPPDRWLLVDDGSTDATAERVREYAGRHPWITLLTHAREAGRSLGSKVAAIDFALRHTPLDGYTLLGVLDADIVLPPDYYAVLAGAFADDPQLGLAGGLTCEEENGEFVPRAYNAAGRIQGAIQVFRTSCWHDIGGYRPLRRGGGDSTAQYMAEMHGWTVQRFDTLRVNHLRPEGTAGKGPLATRFYQGLKDYALGYHPLFVLAKCAYRAGEPPLLAGAAARAWGYCYGALTREPRPLPPEVMQYVRRQQLARFNPRRG